MQREISFIDFTVDSSKRVHYVMYGSVMSNDVSLPTLGIVRAIFDTDDRAWIEKLVDYIDNNDVYLRPNPDSCKCESYLDLNPDRHGIVTYDGLFPDSIRYRVIIPNGDNFYLSQLKPSEDLWRIYEKIHS